MADKATIQTYEKEAKNFIKRYKELKPYRMQELVDTFFVKGARALDIGCASGRDIRLLKEKGFQVTGLDAVEEFVQHCKSEFPDTAIIKESLPTLSSIADESYENILLCAVLMHLAGEDLIEAVSNIVRVTTPEGRILISIRPALKEVEREEDGRLFSSIAPSKLINLFEGFGAKLLFHETTYENTHLGEKTWHNFVFEKVDLSKKSGIESIQV